MKYLLIIFCLSTNTFAELPYIPKTKTVTKGGNIIGIHSDLWQTTASVDHDGIATSLASSTNYYKFDGAFVGRYGVTDQLEATLATYGRYAYSDTAYGTDELNFTISGLLGYSAGFRYSFQTESTLDFAMEGSYFSSAFSNPEFTGIEAPEAIVLGDDSRQLEFGFNISYRTQSANFFTTQILYRSPGVDLSPEVYTNTELAIVWKSAALIGGVEYLASMKSDPYTNDTSNKPQVYTATTNLYNSINRAWIKPHIGLHFKVGEKWTLETQYYQVIAGNSTDLGRGVQLNFIRRSTNEKKQFEKKVQSFKQYTIEAEVTKVSKNRKTVLIDVGLTKGLAEGMRIDFYIFDFVGGNKLIASGYAVKVKSGKALVKISKRYTKDRMVVGIVARAGLISD